MEALGALIVLIILGTPVAIGAFVFYKFGPRIEAKKRDRQIETYMRLGVRDAEAQERIGRQIVQERYGNNGYGS
jgi:hypothetical protein